MYQKLTSPFFWFKTLALVGAVLLTTAYTANKVEAASAVFQFEHDCVSAPSVCGLPIGMLEFDVDTPANVPPSSSVPITFGGTAVEALGSVPICPTISYGGNGMGSMGSYQSIPGDVGNCFTKNFFLTTAPMYFTAPATPGTYSFCASGDTTNVEYMEINGTQCMNYQVGSPTVGNINVSANIAGASWTLSGPTALAGSGLSQSYTSVPTGMYTLTFNGVAGYTTPPSQTLTLNNGGTINFAQGNYISLATAPGGSCILGTQGFLGLDECIPYPYAVEVYGVRLSDNTTVRAHVTTPPGDVINSCPPEPIYYYADLLSLPMCSAVPSVNLNFVE